MLKTFANGFGMIGLASLLAQDSSLFANPTAADPWLAALSDPAQRQTRGGAPRLAHTGLCSRP